MRKKYRRSSSANGFGGLFLGGLLIVGLFLGGIVGYKLLNSRIERFDRFNLVVASSKVQLISLSKLDNSAVVVTFPNDLYLKELAHGYGQYKIERIFSVGQLDHRGGEVLTKTMQDYVGVPVGAYLVTQSFDPNLKNFFARELLKGEKLTSLDFFDRLELVWLAAKIRFDRVKKIDLTPMAGPLVLPDGSKAAFLEKEDLDNLLGGLFTEDKVRVEGLRVEVLNATDTAGLANRAARLLTNIGMTVINVDSSQIGGSGCQVESGEKYQNSLTVRRIRDIFSCRYVRNETLGRADVALTVSQDYADEFIK